MATVRYDDITYQTYGDLPVVGSHAPDINLVNTKLANVSLSNWTGMRKIMNIFVSVDTTVCARSVTEFERLGIEVTDDKPDAVVVSFDRTFTYEKLKKACRLIDEGATLEGAPLTGSDLGGGAYQAEADTLTEAFIAEVFDAKALVNGIVGLLAFLLGIVIARLVQLQVVDHELFAEKSQGNRVRIVPAPPIRGR